MNRVGGALAFCGGEFFNRSLPDCDGVLPDLKFELNLKGGFRSDEVCYLLELPVLFLDCELHFFGQPRGGLTLVFYLVTKSSIKEQRGPCKNETVACSFHQSLVRPSPVDSQASVVCPVLNHLEWP